MGASVTEWILSPVSPNAIQEQQDHYECIGPAATPTAAERLQPVVGAEVANCPMK